MATEPLPVDRGPVYLRDRLRHESTNVELRQKYLATRGPDLARQDFLVARRGVLWARQLRDTWFLLLLGVLGGALGAPLLRELFVADNPLTIAAKVGVGAALVTSMEFCFLAGACGHVVFAELVGDYSEAASRRPASAISRAIDVLVEMVGGAVWGTICGLLIGVFAGCGAWLWLSLDGGLSGPLGLALVGAFGGALAGWMLAGAAAVVVLLGNMNVGSQHAALGPLPWWGYGLSPRAARKKFLPPKRARASPSLN